jgi:hypothetical protein
VALLLVAIHAGRLSLPPRSTRSDWSLWSRTTIDEKRKVVTYAHPMRGSTRFRRSIGSSRTNYLMEPAKFVVWSRSRTRADPWDVQAKRERDEHGAVGERDEAGKEPDSGSWCLYQLRRSLYTCVLRQSFEASLGHQNVPLTYVRPRPMPMWGRRISSSMGKSSMIGRF